MTDALLHDLVRRQAGATPDAIAVEVGSTAITYAELEALSNRVARALLSLGVRPGDRIGVHLPKGIEAVAAMLGAVKVGAAYVPADPVGPAARALAVIEHCGVSVLVSSPSLLAAGRAAGGPPACVRHVVVVDGGAQPLGVHPVHSPNVFLWQELQTFPDSPGAEPRCGDDELAYILSTSGSTGTPKGVMLSHRNALAFVEWAVREFDVQPADRLAGLAPFHFDLSVFDLYAAFAAGARVVLLGEDQARWPAGVVRTWCERDVTIAYCVPSALVLMLEQGAIEATPPPALDRLLVAGEVFPLPALRRLMRALPHTRFSNLYGPTETNVCTVYHVKPGDATRSEPLPIGRACCGSRIELLDDAGRPVSQGAAGWLWVEGPTVMLGYWPPDPGRAPQARYCTGDRASCGSDGELRFHGRRDSVVKVRGVRVEAGEVEAALARHRDVVEAVVLARRDNRTGSYLQAVVTARRPELSVIALKRHCAQWLPEGMIPRVVTIVPWLNRTSSGKVDRIGVSRRWPPREDNCRAR